MELNLRQIKRKLNMGSSIYKAIKVLKDKNQDPVVRSYAISALGKIGPDAKKAVPYLIEAWKDESWSKSSYVTHWSHSWH